MAHLCQSKAQVIFFRKNFKKIPDGREIFRKIVKVHHSLGYHRTGGSGMLVLQECDHIYTDSSCGVTDFGAPRLLDEKVAHQGTSHASIPGGHPVTGCGNLCLFPYNYPDCPNRRKYNKGYIHRQYRERRKADSRSA